MLLIITPNDQNNSDVANIFWGVFKINIGMFTNFDLMSIKSFKKNCESFGLFKQL